MAEKRFPVACVDCGGRFRPYPEEEELDGGGRLVYLKCPLCEARYGVARISANGVEVRRQIRELREKGKTSGNSKRFRQLVERLRREVTRIE